MKTALLIIDVQHALCHGEFAGFEADRVIANINMVSQRVRDSGGLVMIVQHESPTGALVYQSKGWQLARGLMTSPTDTVIRKTATDAFHSTELHATLSRHAVNELVVCGLQSEFCVDTTVRRALALGYSVTLVADGHTTMDNGILTAAQISAHHNKTLSDITSFGPRVFAILAADILGDA